jgi:hypothetical protein
MRGREWLEERGPDDDVEDKVEDKVDDDAMRYASMISHPWALPQETPIERWREDTFKVQREGLVSQPPRHITRTRDPPAETAETQCLALVLQS